MSGSASRASIFEVMNIKNDKKQANLTARTFEFSYYESVYSPEITAFLRYIDSSGALKADKEQDIQEREGSIKSSLPFQLYVLDKHILFLLRYFHQKIENHSIQSYLLVLY